ncbi:MAG: zinc ribbon domain-containing protein [Urechidicola sp.]|nr:zinc ribbon domain-containing protein [Urechidicola sp.]
MKNNCTKCDSENNISSKFCSKCGYELPKIEPQNTKIEKPIKKGGRRGSKKKIAGIIFGIIAFGLAYFGTQQLFPNSDSLDKTLMKVASEINKTCPIMIDSETRLDNTISLPDKILQYNYTAINIVKDSLNIDDAKNQLEPNIINIVKNNPQMKTLKDYKTTFNYYYKDKNGKFLFIISVTPDKYE